MTRIKSKLVPVLVSSVITFCACGSIENTVFDAEQSTDAKAEKTPINPHYTTESSISFGKSIDVYGFGVYIENEAVNITKGGSYSVTGQIKGLSININVSADETVVLKLDNVTLTVAGKPVIKCQNAAALNITLVRGSKNSLLEAEKESVSGYETDDPAFIFSNCPVTLSGEGDLLIRTAESSGFTEAFRGECGLNVKEAVLNIDSPGIDSIILGGDFICESGTVNIKAAQNGIRCREYILENGNVDIIANGEKIVQFIKEFDMKTD